MIHYLVFNLIIAHILGDFYLQTNKSCENKFLYKLKGKSLWLHSLLIGALSWISIWDIRGWWLALIIMLIHFLTDWFKSCLQAKMGVLAINDKNEVVPGTNKRIDIVIFLIDQIVHVAILIVGAYVWFYMNNDWMQQDCLREFIINHPLRVKTFVALLLVLKPANILILLILETCMVKVPPQESNAHENMLKVPSQESNAHENFRSGALIGWLERALILVFVIMSQYEAIGFLIAAKSILRFSETSKGDVKSEYVLTGTLLSLTIALFLGILVLHF